MSSISLSSAVAAIKGFLIDLDGTLYIGNELIPGSREFIHRLRDRNLPHAFVTNITSRPRSEVLARIREKGLEIDPASVLTAPIATKGYLDRQSIGPCFFLTRPRLVEDFAGQQQIGDSLAFHRARVDFVQCDTACRDFCLLKAQGARHWNCHRFDGLQ